MGAEAIAMSDNNITELEQYNVELAKCIEELSAKKLAIAEQIRTEKEARNKYEEELRTNTEKLSRINDSLGRKVSARNEYDTTIQETEAAYLKILESSQTLDHVMKRQGESQSSLELLPLAAISSFHSYFML